MNPYLTVTARYIDGSVEHPDSWKLHSKVIGYTIIHGDHSGANIAAVILKVLDCYGPGEKVSLCYHWDLQANYLVK